MNPRLLFIIRILSPMVVTGCTSLVGTLDVEIDNSGAAVQTQAPAIESPPDNPEPVPTEPVGENPASSLTGSASGRVCYPSEMIPAMTAFFQDTSRGKITELTILEQQASYTVELPPGQYIAFAYLSSGADFGGSYSNAVPCGLSVECTDHSPLPFDVKVGESTEGIDLCDWYAPEIMPPNPNAIRAPLSGLIYSTPQGEINWIQPDGDSKHLYGNPGVAIPWVGPVGVYAENNDLQAVDLFTGETFNLTNTPDMVETSYQFEVGLPGQVLFTAVPAGEELAPGMTGGLYSINMDGSNLHAVDASNNVGKFAASPDGQTIAWGFGETGFLYKSETGIQTFDPRQYGMNSPWELFIASPSWSPLGDKLAWFAIGSFNGQKMSGYAIFDLNAKTYTLVHPFNMPGTDGFPPAALWSPDGEWLAVNAADSDAERNGIWLVNTANPQQEIFMGSSSGNPIFGPWTADQKIVAYTRYDEATGGSKVWIYDLVSGEQQVTSLPPNAQVLKWW